VWTQCSEALGENAGEFRGPGVTSMASEIKCSVKRNVETLMSHFIRTHTLSPCLSLSFFWPSRARWELAGCEPDGRSEQEFAFCTLLSLRSDEDLWHRFFVVLKKVLQLPKFSRLRFQGFVSETLRAFCLGMLSRSRDSLIENVCFLRYYDRRFRQLFRPGMFEVFNEIVLIRLASC
jgi:hypothetical protein